MKKGIVKEVYKLRKSGNKKETILIIFGSNLDPQHLSQNSEIKKEKRSLKRKPKP